MTGGELSECGYIQGAGDDTENWAHGLTPLVFWNNRDRLMSSTEADLPEIIEALMDRQEASDASRRENLIKPTSCLFISSLSKRSTEGNIAQSCKINLLPRTTSQETWQTSPDQLDIGLGASKLGGRNLRASLPVISAFVENAIISKTINGDKKIEKHILIACESGNDFSIGVGLAIACLYFDNSGNVLDKGSQRPKIDKAFIRSRLGWFSLSMPDANPSRTTLQSVNSFLMDRPL